MSNSDKSASARTRQLRNRTLAYYYDSNPGTRESATNTTFSAAAHTARVSGQYAFTVQHALKPNVVSDACCGAEPAAPCDAPGDVSNFNASIYSGPVPPPYDTTYNAYTDVSWDPGPGATSYTLTSNDPLDLVVSTGETTATIYLIDAGPDRTLTLTATNSCGSSTGTTTAYPCFLEGALVTMADYSTKPIELVCVGDHVLGAFGEINTVLALHRPLLGGAKMCRINDEHSTTNHHPHIGADKRFFCGDPALVSARTYGMEHDVLLADGVPGRMFLHGLKKERINQLVCGVDLKTVEGSRLVSSLEVYELPPETQLYNLVVGGSHTYHVEGYAVTGWPREDDFDYDAWAPIA